MMTKYYYKSKWIFFVSSRVMKYMLELIIFKDANTSQNH